MIVYLDDAYRCHLSNDGTLTAVETEFFNGKCQTYIEGYRFVPAGKSWTRNDGMVFNGEMVSPCKDIRILEAAQAEYEKNQAEMADMQAALSEANATIAELDAALLDTTYNYLLTEE